MGRGQFDLLAYHPETKYLHNRPEWLFQTRDQKYFLNKESITIDSKPCILKAYLISEGEMAVPYDVVEVNLDEIGLTALVLPEGIYNLSIENQSDEIQRLRIDVRR